MKILIDENISRRLTKLISGLCEAVTHVSKINLEKHSDRDIWNTAKTGNWIILTKDNDFQFYSSVWGCPPKVIRINCGNKSTQSLADIIESKAADIQSFAESEDCYLEIIEKVGI